jgi:hypothetical protein
VVAVRYPRSPKSTPFHPLHLRTHNCRLDAPELDRYFALFYRNVTWNYRGYPPSDDPAAYSQEHPVADLLALLTVQGLAGVGAESDVWFFAGALA